VQIAKSKGEFRVTWHYRNDALNRACRRLVATGLLRRSRRGGGGVTIYEPARPRRLSFEEMLA
jgi:predicted transcriptional regulator